jgi:hypothetical protein
MKCDCGCGCGVLCVKRFGSKNSLSSSREVSRGRSRWRQQVVEAVTHIETTGKCVRKYGSDTGKEGEPWG